MKAWQKIGDSDVLLQSWVGPDSVLALELLVDVPFLETIEINQHVLVNLWDEIETWAIMFKMSDLND